MDSATYDTSIRQRLCALVHTLRGAPGSAAKRAESPNPTVCDSGPAGTHPLPCVCETAQTRARPVSEAAFGAPCPLADGTRYCGSPRPSVPAGRLLPLCPAGLLFGRALGRPRYADACSSGRRFRMVKKNFLPKPVRQQPAPRTARPVTVIPSRAAHPRLIHGFLVRLVARSTIPAAATTPALGAVPSAKARGQRSSNAKREGPADDATFH